MLGARLGAYEVVELIGNGGMGSVYRGVRIDEASRKRSRSKSSNAVSTWIAWCANSGGSGRSQPASNIPISPP